MLTKYVWNNANVIHLQFTCPSFYTSTLPFSTKYILCFTFTLAWCMYIFLNTLPWCHAYVFSSVSVNYGTIPSLYYEPYYFKHACFIFIFCSLSKIQNDCGNGIGSKKKEWKKKGKGANDSDQEKIGN